MSNSLYHANVLYNDRMKAGANWFRRGQLEKMFILFPDPHFKRSNFRRRIVNPNFLGILSLPSFFTQPTNHHHMCYPCHVELKEHVPRMVYALIW
jgi:hypothetical protein